MPVDNAEFKNDSMVPRLKCVRTHLQCQRIFYFRGVFRLDQFHIALCLLLGTLVTLFIPHIPEDFEFLCAVLAVLVNFFPLCAFAWKFIFGLNALLMM